MRLSQAVGHLVRNGGSVISLVFQVDENRHEWFFSFKARETVSAVGSRCRQNRDLNLKISRGCLGDYVKEIKNWSGTIIFPRSIKHSIEFVTLSLPLGAWNRQQNGNNNNDEFE